MDLFRKRVLQNSNSSSGCSACDHWCIDNVRWGSESECDGTNVYYFIILTIVIVGIIVGLLLWIIIVYIKRKKFNKELEELQKRALGNLVKHGKVRKRRGIILGIPIPKNIPIKCAEMRASVELDKLKWFNKNLFQELKDQNPSFEILFEKNLPEYKYIRKHKSSISSQSSGSRTQRWIRVSVWKNG